MRVESEGGKNSREKQCGEMAGCPDRLAQVMHGGKERWVRGEPRSAESAARF